MLKGLDSRQKIEYVSKHDEDEPKTVFVIMPLTGVAMINLSTLNKKGKIQLKGEDVIDMLDGSVYEIKNHPDNDKLTKREILEALEFPIIEELMAEVQKINNLTEDDKKK